MAQICREVQEAIEEKVEKPVESWVNQLQQVCQQQECNWWCLCCNKWLCWLAWVLVRVVTLIVVTITKWVTRIVCEAISFVLDVAAFIVNLILSIPILGGIIRTVLNWLTEIFWRLISIPDFVLTLFGVQIPKKMYVKVIITNSGGKPLANEAAVVPFIQAAQAVYKTECNINLVYKGTCTPEIATPSEARVVSCTVDGFFGDWLLAGSYYEFVSSTCAFEDGWRRVLGYGAELIVFIIGNVTPDSPQMNTIGCSFGPTHNYVVEEVGDMSAIAHELGHACGLWHVDDTMNLMNPFVTASSTTLSGWQRAIVRNSRHCVFV